MGLKLKLLRGPNGTYKVTRGLHYWRWRNNGGTWTLL